ncbi:MAG: Cna B-type domain-containing protein, partial [Erysipelotrichaceae bacterium]|nr:Cna B-type domain-containing protein [Erysipelotrichaceae bacterium]
NWHWSFGGLVEYDPITGKKYEYTLTEDPVPNYTSVVNGLLITNTYTGTPTETSATVVKVWNDSNNKDGARPSELKVKLLADGNEVTEVTLNDGNNWTKTIDHLPIKNNGATIVYTWAESSISNNYTLTNVTQKGTVTTLENSHTPELMSVSVEKNWKDNNDSAKKRPGSITVHLLADGKEVDKQVIKEDSQGDWKYTWTDLPKYASGQTIVYTVNEDTVTDYSTDILCATTTALSVGCKITNTYDDPSKIDISGSKTWDDSSNQDGLRPSVITIRLLADGKEVQYMNVTQKSGWKWNFTGLPKTNAGKDIVYTIVEDAVSGYTSKVNGYNVTNTHKAEVMNINGSKVWNDSNDKDKLRPGKIDIYLLADGKVVKTMSVTASTNWTFSFSNLPKYKNGKEIKYTLAEKPVSGYTTSISGYTITNTHIVKASATTNTSGNGTSTATSSKANAAGGIVTKTPNTSDESDMSGLMGAMVASLMGMVAIIYLRKEEVKE